MTGLDADLLQYLPIDDPSTLVSESLSDLCPTEYLRYRLIKSLNGNSYYVLCNLMRSFEVQPLVDPVLPSSLTEQDIGSIR